MLSSILATALSQTSRSSPKIDEALPKLYDYLAGLTNSQDTGLQDIAVQEYSAVLRTKPAREQFWDKRKQTVSPLFEILRTAVGATKDTDSTLWSGATSIRAGEGAISGGIGIQLLYHVLMVIWLLSFEGSTIGQELEAYKFLPPSRELC